MLEIKWKGETALAFKFLFNRFQNPPLFLFNRSQNPPLFHDE